MVFSESESESSMTQSTLVLGVKDSKSTAGRKRIRATRETAEARNNARKKTR